MKPKPQRIQKLINAWAIRTFGELYCPSEYMPEVWPTRESARRACTLLGRGRVVPVQVTVIEQ